MTHKRVYFPKEWVNFTREMTTRSTNYGMPTVGTTLNYHEHILTLVLQYTIKDKHHYLHLTKL